MLTLDPDSPIPVIRKPRASTPWATPPRKRGSRVTTRLDGAAYWQHHLAKRAAIAAEEERMSSTLAPVLGISARVDAALGITR